MKSQKAKFLRCLSQNYQIPHASANTVRPSFSIPYSFSHALSLLLAGGLNCGPCSHAAAAKTTWTVKQLGIVGGVGVLVVAVVALIVIKIRNKGKGKGKGKNKGKGPTKKRVVGAPSHST